jgi:predicted PurR-regulated permease PerM
VSSANLPQTQVEEPPAVATLPPRVTASELASWILLGSALLFVLMRELVPGLVAGIVLYLVLNYFSRTIEGRLSRGAARLLALIIVALIAGGAVTAAIAFIVAFARGHAGNLPALLQKMAEIIASTRLLLSKLGPIGNAIPDITGDAEDLQQVIVKWLKENAELIKSAGGTFGRAVIHIVMGSLLAVMVFFRHRIASRERRSGPLAHHLSSKLILFTDAFNKIVTAQVKISAVNTTLTALYLWVVLPLAGKALPLSLTIVLVTFLCGLIPILGNLISNAVIVVVSLGVSFPTAIASLVFLILIHKLEYVINSRIVGGHTDSQGWEILMAILIGETSFGISGVVMAPIIYAFVKRELRDRGLV